MAGKFLRYSMHARRRMRDRRISEAEVEQAVSNAESSYQTSSSTGDCTVILGRTDAGRRLKVVLSDTSPGLVVTVADRDTED